MRHKNSTAVFAIPPSVHVLDFGGPAQVFYEALEAGVALELKFVSLHKGYSGTASSCGVEFANLGDYNTVSVKQADIIFVPGLAFELLHDRVFLDSTRGFLEWLIEQYYNGATICSICTGAFLLAESGLLNGKECTTHWKYLSQFQEQYKMVKMVSNRLFVESDNIFTSAGVASGIDLALYILEKRYGSLFASRIAREIVIYFRRAGND